MKKILIFLSLIIWSNAFSQITFQNTYGGSNNEQGWEVLQLSNGSYIIAGTTRSFGHPEGDFYLIKVNENGNLLWQKTYGDTEADFCWSFDKSLDGGYILAGKTNSFGAQSGDYYFIKVDSLGILEWQKHITNTNLDKLKDVFQSYDSCYYFLGETSVSGNGNNNDIQVVKTDANGNTIWVKTYGGEFNDIPNCFIQSSDSNILIGGGTKNFGAIETDVLLIKIDSSGNTIWNKTIGGLHDDVGQHVIETFDDGYMISGYSQSSTSGSMNKLYLVKTNNLGDTTWTSSFNNHFFVNGNCIAQTVDSGYIITGNENITGYNPNLYLFKVDKYGVEEWSVTYGGNGLDYGLCVKQTDDEGFIVSGTNSSIGSGGEDVFLLKTNNLGITTGIAHKEFDKLIEIFPNPTTKRITVKANNLTRIELMDLSGKEIYTKETQSEIQEIDLSEQTKGIYLIKIILADSFIVKKIIKQ